MIKKTNANNSTESIEKTTLDRGLSQIVTLYQIHDIKSFQRFKLCKIVFNSSLLRVHSSSIPEFQFLNVWRPCRVFSDIVPYAQHVLQCNGSSLIPLIYLTPLLIPHSPHLTPYGASPYLLTCNMLPVGLPGVGRMTSRRCLQAVTF